MVNGFEMHKKNKAKEKSFALSITINQPIVK
jgi:hypothetical protein